MNRQDLLIEADELASLIDHPDLRLFDTTVLLGGGTDARDNYTNGHIPGAVFLDHNSLSDPDADVMFMVPDETTLGNAIGNIGVSNDSIVVVYSTGELCWATRAWWVLRYAGHRNVRVLNGGFGAWQGDLDISIKNYDPASFTTSLSPDMFANINDVETALNDLGTCIVNALPEVIYSGEMETPYSGHIPGTVNHPMHEFMDGQFIRSDDELKTLFADKLDQERLITYCGGGVAATLNASAALLAGVKSVAVYDGSMSEWLSRDKPVMAGIDSG